MWGGMTYKGAHHSSRNVMTGTANDCESLLQPNKNNSALRFFFFILFVRAFIAHAASSTTTIHLTIFFLVVVVVVLLVAPFSLSLSLAEQTKRMCAY
jgi:hypothetical protein